MFFCTISKKIFKYNLFLAGEVFTLHINLKKTAVFVIIFEYNTEKELMIDMEEKIKKVLVERVNPILADHYGGATLSKLEDGIAYVRLTGACASCPSAQETIENVIKAEVMANVEGVKDVILDTSLSEELLDMARRILRGEEKL